MMEDLQFITTDNDAVSIQYDRITETAKLIVISETGNIETINLDKDALLQLAVRAFNL